MVQHTTPNKPIIRSEAKKLVEAVTALQTWAQQHEDIVQLQPVLEKVEAIAEAAEALVDAKKASLDQATFFVKKSTGDIPGRDTAATLLSTTREMLDTIEDAETRGALRELMHNVIIATEGVGHAIEKSMPLPWTAIVNRVRYEQQQGDKDNGPHSGKTR